MAPRITLTGLTLLTVLACGSSTSSGNPIYTPVVAPVSPVAADSVPDVSRVPKKRFTDSSDMNYNPTPHAIDPTQIGQFDGLGGARNGLRLADFEPQLELMHIDAQSQINDPLFDAVVANETPLVVSTRADLMLGSNVALAAERTTGAVQSFATSTQVVNHPHAGGQLGDINSVDLWGTEGQSTAGFYSFNGDTTGIAVYSNTLLGPGGVVPYLTTGQIAGALGHTVLTPFIDVDALMVRDVGTGFFPFDNNFGPGDAIMFSLAPISVDPNLPSYDGGEIWVWEFGQQAQFLSHGGHLWDTAHSVLARLGGQSENVDALEAVGVPEPTTCMLAALAALALCSTRTSRSAIRACSGN